MTYMRCSDDEDALHQDVDQPSPNEQLLRYIGPRDSSMANMDRGYLVRADSSYLGTDFP